MKSKIKQILKLFKRKTKQIKKQSPEINVINFNRNNFGYPILNNEEKLQINKSE